MISSRTIFKRYKELVISPKEIVDLARICYTPWKNDYDTANRKWRSVKLPQIEKLIDEHNKDVEAKKSVYSFNTYLPIEEGDKKVIIEKERDYFIHTSERVYEFNTSFIIRHEGETMEYRSPDDLKLSEIEKAIEIEFEIKSQTENKSIQIEISTSGLDEHLSYTIEGKSDVWISKTKEEIEAFLDSCQKPHELTKYKFFLVATPTAFLTYTLYKVFEKIGLTANIFHLLSFINDKLLGCTLGLLIFVPLLVIIAREVNYYFPKFAIRSKYHPLDSTFAILASFFISSIFSPFIYEFISYIFSNGK